MKKNVWCTLSCKQQIKSRSLTLFKNSKETQVSRSTGQTDYKLDKSAFAIIKYSMYHIYQHTKKIFKRRTYDFQKKNNNRTFLFLN